MTNRLYKNHDKNEKALADLVAQETLLDLFGGEERRVNGPAFLMGLVAIIMTLLFLALLGAGVLYLLGAS
ncbi:MAG: hypothetical protein KDE46_03140 [Caldilineaceae bacterium]|nr:hypothetical protein [Caldilineaceae bacterium]